MNEDIRVVGYWRQGLLSYLRSFRPWVQITRILALVINGTVLLIRHPCGNFHSSKDASKTVVKLRPILVVPFSMNPIRPG